MIAPAQPGMPSTPRTDTGSGGPINIHVENGDVHIHNGGGGARISVEGRNPFSVDTTRSQGDKDRVSGAFSPEAVAEKFSGTLTRSFGVGDLRKSFSGDGDGFTKSPATDAYIKHWREHAGAFQADFDPVAGIYYDFVGGDDAAKTWTTEQLAGVQQAYATWLPQATADAVRAYTFYAPSAAGQPASSAPGTARAPEGALEELLRLVREVHADVRALRSEMQTLRDEVEHAPPAGAGARSFRGSAPGGFGATGGGARFGAGSSGGSAPSASGGSAGFGGSR